MQFIDEATIDVAAGRGGDGLVAWRREKFVPKGGPAGGDGGRGGDVVLEARHDSGTLIEFRFKRTFAAANGENGGSSNKSGRAADDLVVPVPIGTIVFRVEPDGTEWLFADLDADDARIRVAAGGRGGLGNQHFATAKRQAPRFAEKGAPPETCSLRLELKLLADAGLVGLPNAGKSTLLAAVSAAKPKIADYPFTTLEPQLGVVRLGPEESFVLVDVPGLIEGAHEGAGLGDRFLRHVERTRVLVHLVDGGSETERIVADIATIRGELEAWNPELARRPTLLVVTKLDLPEARERLAELRERFPEIRGISAATGEGVRELLGAAYETIRTSPVPAVVPSETPRFTLAPNEPFDITIDHGVYVIRGERVERLAEMTDFESLEALGRFEGILAKLGVDARLRALGARTGDLVRISGNEFEYS